MRILLSGLLVLLSLACGHSTAAGPSFSLTVAPGQIRLLPGLGRTVTVAVSPQPGFSGTVEFSATDLGPGLEARFTPASLTLADGVAAQTTLQLTAREDIPPGKRSIGLQASGSGAFQSIDLILDIPAATFFTVLTYRGSEPGNFAYLAYQDGDGSWTSVPGTAGVYRLPVTDPGGRFGVLLGDACQGETSSNWISNGFFSTLGEVQLLQALVFCNPQPGPPPVTFDLSGGLAGGLGRSILIGANSGLWSFPAGATDYALKLIKGSSDLVAAAYPSTQDYLPSRIIVDRGRDAQAPMTRDFDFSSQGADTGTPVAIQRPPLNPGEVFQGNVQFQTSRGQTAILGYGQDLAAYAPVPAAVTQPGDAWLYSFQATAQNQYRTLQGSGTEPPGALAPQLPSAIPPFDLASTGGPAPRLSFSWTAVTPAPNVHEAVITQQIGTRQAYCYLYFGKSWHAGAARLTWTQPDLSAVPGFDPRYFPLAGSAARVALYQSGSQSGQAAGSALREPFTFAAPPGPALRPLETPGNLGMRLQFQGTAANVITASPRTEFWAASRTQSLVP